ncbi:MAG: hypothetical protein A2504_09285 [Bdellovibrionales bacterium RIFOXYD12_FULL_39_22]|nr:MAG: hypothetical protein A2385_17265 [Bdellovibrionales bacterium RIFOXYB1_FULL_39_21]OFZ41066.1 MAG: hypothetical protein A2485_00190 [Bdellovibrionales bacterium RIFOXYC12_FULL_39_17]OFZ50279.1 MAG: hypothetical protein A2404_07505 [Bdellovibrionales bacterium RIFOXYC1_FULL_39_130]OFZ71045.1 MAG: hypothetical protein A2451_16055 [Bdellovibrionales bacterium RIFOXYC2_FULL_39_8]OFZ75080.1 MAG: hypothetical protein A2560_16200 [Bdellovibrionales bacterium RIFOXYD1_FULL_39_84]OFZ92278.1 MAG:
MNSWMVSAIVGILLILSSSLFARNKVIYGDDNRLDLFEATDGLHLQLAQSTAAQIGNSTFIDDGVSDYYTIKGGTLQSGMNLCADERFANQTAVARCSGFLVGPDLLVTAGHCVTKQSDCDGFKWAFDYNVTDEGRPIISTLLKSSVYSCVSIVERAQSSSNSDDYALIKLDRPVTDRAPLIVRREGKIGMNTEVVVIGHPSGLPTKISAGARVRETAFAKYFVTNLDTFGGNSGSAVFDSQTGVVEGILVRGENDYVYDYDSRCRRPQQCTEDGCRGEDVTRITNIKALMKILANN